MTKEEKEHSWSMRGTWPNIAGFEDGEEGLEPIWHPLEAGNGH